MQIRLSFGALLILIACALAPLPAHAARPAGEPTPQLTPQFGGTGIPEVDRVIDQLMTGDAAALAHEAHFTDRACTTQPQIGDVPCPSGVADGSMIPTLPSGSCEGGFFLDRDTLREFLGKQLAGAHSIYGVARTEPAEFLRGDYVIALTQGDVPRATSPVTLFWVDAEGGISAVLNECGPTGAARRLGDFVKPPDFVLGPFTGCTFGERVDGLTITIAAISGDVFAGSIFASEAPLSESPSGERYIIDVKGSTRFKGNIHTFNDLRTGDTIGVAGTREADCAIIADIIDTSSAPQPQLRVEPASGACDATVMLIASDLPSDAVVAFRMILPNSDVLQPRFAEGQADDAGSLRVRASLGSEGCTLAALSRQVGGPGRIFIAADQANQPDDLEIYAQAVYQADAGAPIGLPGTGEGPSDRHSTPFLALASLFAALAAVTLVASAVAKRVRRSDARISR